MSSERELLEESVVELLAPLVADGTFVSVLAVGGVDEATVMESALAGVPCALVQYTGKAGGRQNGGMHEYRAQINVLLMIENLSSLEARRGDSYRVQDLVEQALADKLPAAGCSPWRMTTERYVAQGDGENVEVWEQIWETQFWKG